MIGAGAWRTGHEEWLESFAKQAERRIDESLIAGVFKIYNPHVTLWFDMPEVKPIVLERYRRGGWTIEEGYEGTSSYIRFCSEEIPESLK